MPQYLNDIFIAYHGTYSPNGSYEEAKSIAAYLRDKGYKVCLFEESDGFSWSKTPRFVIESKTMLVVLNQGVLTDDNDLIVEKRVVAGKTEPYQIFAEIATFKDQVNSGNRSPQAWNFVYCGQDKTSEEARKFCARQAYGIDALNNILGRDYKSMDGMYEPVENWLKTALHIQEKWDLERYGEKNSDIIEETLDDVFAEIENEMFAQNCVAVFGPTLNDLCVKFSEGTGSSFFDRCRSLINKGRNHLDDALNKTFSKGLIPRHVQHFAKFPFAAFLTTDGFSRVNEAIQLAGKESALIKEESDIYSLRLQDGQIPVFQLKRSNVWTDDCLVPNEIVSAVLKMLLVGRRILYIGYNDQYDGYKRVGAALRKLLGDDFFTCTNNIAVVESKNNPPVYYDEENRFTVINVSVDEFAKKMETSNDLFKKLLNMNGGDNKFVIDLFKIAAVPTETQATQLLLDQLTADVRQRTPITEIIEKYDTNVRCLKALKPNFNAFEKCWLRIREELSDGDIDSIQDLELVVNQFKTERSQISNMIRMQGRNNLSDAQGANILIYSQSVRVVEYLIGARTCFKNASSLWVCECRPKSDEPFSDAQNTCELLRENEAHFKKINIIPDMAAFNMMSRGLIDMIVLGAHDVVMRNGKPISFINTCGSIGLINFARLKGIPVYVIAEKGKFTEAVEKDGELIYEISYGHETTIYNNFKFVLWTKQNNINTENIGYDFCKVYRGVTIVSEEGSIVCEDVDLKITLVDMTKGG